MVALKDYSQQWKQNIANGVPEQGLQDTSMSDIPMMLGLPGAAKGILEIGRLAANTARVGLPFADNAAMSVPTGFTNMAEDYATKMGAGDYRSLKGLYAQLEPTRR